ncbi:hypothetical protein Clacol_006486 [Clathrus columnatus]|uniref:Cullin family profile domain-containing protein n=1 Tax=Clathrus columnatus TaxID=1419009 RepID=A0AAV5AH82_9AGAM|nr:hypothetical protein Clacol_006486 [Clathrus columnatus]
MALLAWPVTSKAFSSINIRPNDDTPGSPPRKAPRLSNTSSRVGSGVNQSLSKKITIYNVYDEPRLDQRESRKAIETMLRSFLNRTDPQNNRLLRSSYKTVFETVETAVVLLGMGADIYSMLRTQLQRTCAEVIAKRLTSQKGLPWLNLLIDEWKWFESQINLLESLFTWLDRAYACPKGILPVRQLGLDIFQDYVIRHVTIHDEIAPCIEECANAERTTHGTVPPHRTQLAFLIRMFQQLGLYESEFEVPYTLIAQKFYKNESDTLSSNGMTPTDFVNHCMRRVEEEVQRCRELLPEKSLPIVGKCVEKALLDNRITWIVGGLLPLLREKNVEGVCHMHDLLARVEAFEPMRLAFAQSTEIIVTEIVLLPIAEEEEMVPRLLQFRAFIDTLLISAFREGGENKDNIKINNEDLGRSARVKTRGPFGYAASDAFAKGFSKRPRKPAEMIAKFIDRSMRYGQRGASDRDFDEKLDSVLGLYQYTTDRDVFRTFYWRGLAKRLLLGRSASDDFEKAVIKKLREGYDPEFGKGNQMFKDLELSKDLMEEFHGKFPNLKHMSAMVLQSSSWPYQPKTGRDIDLPPSLLSNLEQFNKFYLTKHERHKIDWHHSLGTVTLTARFPAGQKELSVSLYQAVVLLLFNEKDRLGFSEIKEQTNLGKYFLR